MYTIVPVAIPDTKAITKTQQLTLFKLAKLAEQKLAKSPDALLTVGLVNLTEDPNPELMAVGGYAVKSAARNFRGFYAMNDVRLGNTIYLVFMPNTVAADKQTKLDDAKSPQVQGLMTELLKQAGVPLKTSARNRGTTAHIDLPGASTPITR
jgi:hypothetical protein